MRFEELWLLEVVVAAHPPWAGWIPFQSLPDDDPDELGSANPNGYGNHTDINFHHHHLSDDQLLSELALLFEAGDIIATIQGRHPRPAKHVFVPTRDEMREALHRNWNEPWLSYTLTAKGFARWEDFAKPNWKLFSHQDGVWQENDWYCTEAANQRVAQYWLKWATSNTRVDWSRAKYDEITPWQVFPFKSLPRGYNARVPIIEDTDLALCDNHTECIDEPTGGIEPWYGRSVKNWNDEMEA